MTPEALQALRERLQATQEAAQRLAEDAARDGAPGDGRVPPAGWDVPRSAEHAGEELDALVALIASLRELLPPELRAQLSDAVRSLLVVVRAVLDWWLARMETAGAQAPAGGRDDVQDIPIA